MSGSQSRTGGQLVTDADAVADSGGVLHQVYLYADTDTEQGDGWVWACSTCGETSGWCPEQDEIARGARFHLENPDFRNPPP